MTASSRRAAFSGALITSACLWGGLFVGIVAGNVVAEAFSDLTALQIGLFSLFPVSGIVLGSLVWGSRMGDLAKSADRRRMRGAGVLGFVPITLALGIGLLFLESPAVEMTGGRLPVHRIFTLLFVPTAFLISGSAAFSIGVAVRGRSEGLGLAWRAGLAAAAAFLVINLLMEAFGWRVGGPNAEERFTMLTVTFAGALGCALATGAVIGHWLQLKAPSEGD